MGLDLTKAQKKVIRRAALAGDYHLLLGAGASLDSTDTYGRPLPMSGDLAAKMATEFTVPIEDDDLLWRIYARAVEEAGEDQVYGWLRGQYWGVKPPNWMDLVSRAQWSTVWTLNIDDSFERSYDRVKSEFSRALRTISWDDNFVQTSDLSVVHLHGCVDRESPRKLVFSLSEYASSASAGVSWPLNFRDIYGVSPFVIIGARLRDEPDIEAVVSNRRPAHDAPSIYVNPRISAAAERDMRSWNLLPVRMTGEEFAEAWADLLQLNASQPPTKREEFALRLGRQFIELRTDTSKVPQSHDFIGGDEPRWSDIQNEAYAELDWIREIKADCRSLGKNGNPSSTAIVYVGPRLSGRSTGILAAGHELRRMSWRTFLFNDDERVDVEAVLGYASDGRSVALLFDNVADFIDDISILLTRARSSGLKVSCVAVDNYEKSASIVGRIDEAYLIHRRVANINSRLTRTDSTRLVDKLQSLARLGILEPKPDRARIAHFRNREIFDAMAELENAPSFGRRISTIVDSLDSPTHLQMLLLVAFAARVSRGVLVIDLARAVGLDSDGVRRAIGSKDGLNAVIRVEGRWVSPKQRWMALEPCIKKIGETEALNFLGEAIRRLQPRLGRASQRERNATSMLVGAFMVYNKLSEMFPDADLEAWYESLAGTFGSWSARYWEQRAIMCRTLGRERPELLARAESFSLRAVGTVRDAYSLTTLGTVLLTKAELGAKEDLPGYYDRAFDAFQDASDDDPGNLVTWLAFLRYSLRVVIRLDSGQETFNDDLVERIHDDWLRVYDSVALIANASDQTKADLQGLRQQYEKKVARRQGLWSFGAKRRPRGTP